GVALEFLLAQPSQGIDTLPSIHCLDRYQDTHLRRDLNHAGSHNTRLSSARSGAVAPFHWIRILPRGPSNSISHSARPAAWGGTSSKNVAGAIVGRTDPGPASTIRLSLPYSRCRALDARKTPCSRAASAAATHNAAGIGKRAVCPFRQRSKRRQSLRRPTGISNGRFSAIASPPPCWV